MEPPKVNFNPGDNAKCPTCGAAFACARAAGDGRCWCADLPHVLPVPVDGCDCAGCLCPACLGSKVSAADRAPDPA